MKGKQFLLLLLSMLPAASAPAASGLSQGYPEDVEAMDAREVAMLPAYCRHTQIFRERIPGGNDQSQIRRWTAVMGPTFHGMHHYCLGLMKTNRALLIARTPQYKAYYLTGSIHEFDYVINRAPPDFPLLPEMLTRKAENLIRLGQGPAATVELQRAIQLKPDYWPPYAVLSDYYKSVSDFDRARAILETGLSLSPESKALKTRLAGLSRER